MTLYMPTRFQDAPPVHPSAQRDLIRYAQMIVWYETKSPTTDSTDYRDELAKRLNEHGVTAEQISRAIFEETLRKEKMTPSLHHTNRFNATNTPKTTTQVRGLVSRLLFP